MIYCSRRYIVGAGGNEEPCHDNDRNEEFYRPQFFLNDLSDEDGGSDDDDDN